MLSLILVVGSIAHAASNSGSCGKDLESLASELGFPRKIEFQMDTTATPGSLEYELATFLERRKVVKLKKNFFRQLVIQRNGYDQNFITPVMDLTYEFKRLNLLIGTEILSKVSKDSSGQEKMDIRNKPNSLFVENPKLFQKLLIKLGIKDRSTPLQCP